MSDSPAGKGDKPRPVDRKGWEESKLWDNLKAAKSDRKFTTLDGSVNMCHFVPEGGHAIEYTGSVEAEVTINGYLIDIAPGDVIYLDENNIPRIKKKAVKK